MKKRLTTKRVEEILDKVMHQNPEIPLTFRCTRAAKAIWRAIREERKNG